jgi:thymidylate kinase
MKKKKDRFNVFPRLISIDGPDGTGKSNLARILHKIISLSFQEESIVIKPTYFDASEEAQIIGEELRKRENLEKSSQEHNSFFLRAMLVNYRTVILPALKDNKWIILDSSEIRSMAFVLDRGDVRAINNTKSFIEQGLLTLGVCPWTRVILGADPETIRSNLLTKKELDLGDPISIEEIERRIRAYKESIGLIKKIPTSKTIQWIYLIIEHQKDELDQYLLNLVEKNITPFIRT